MAWEQGEVSIVINRPVGEVFAYAENVANLQQWAGVEKAEITAGAQQELGSKLTISTTILGKRVETNSELIAFEPNHLSTYRSTKPILSEMTMIYEEMGTQTKVTRRIAADAGNLFKAAYPLVKRKLAREAEKTMAQLKSALEQRVTQSAQ